LQKLSNLRCLKLLSSAFVFPADWFIWTSNACLALTKLEVFSDWLPQLSDPSAVPLLQRLKEFTVHYDLVSTIHEEIYITTAPLEPIVNVLPANTCCEAQAIDFKVSRQ
jgi:hypothetical protein